MEILNFVTFSLTVKEVFCIFKKLYSTNTCIVDQTINREVLVLGSPINTTVQAFEIRKNRKVEYLPRDIGHKFPNLLEFWADSCNLAVIREFYFENMRNLQSLDLRDNKIVNIESRAFKDLTSLTELFLQNNLIVTLNEKLFSTMTNLVEIYLLNNKIKYLNPATFTIPAGRLKTIYLLGNVCINHSFDSTNFYYLESDLRALCTQS